MKYIIEGKKTQNDLTVLWVRSRWYPGEYFEAEAHRIIGESASRNVQYRMTPVMPEEHMKYKIELWCGYDLHGCWSRAWSYPGEYTKVKAEELISRPGNARFKWRIVSLGAIRKPEKKYRRHAVVTPLELRGAIQMLTNARQHIVSDVNSSTEGLGAFAAFQVITQARLECVRHLESL